MPQGHKNKGNKTILQKEKQKQKKKQKKKNKKKLG